MPRIVVGETSEDVEVLGIDGYDQHLNAVLVQAFRDGVGDKLAKLCGDPHRVAFHEGFGELIEVVICALEWRILVVALHMFAVVQRAPSPRVASEPEAVGVDSDVVPVVPGEFCGFVSGDVVFRGLPHT
jgi:hypothetical protein